MARVVVFHTNLNLLGGGERVCLGFLKAAKGLGHTTELVTMVPPNWRRIASFFGEATIPDRVISLFDRPKRFEKYRRFLMFSFSGQFRDADTITVNSTGYRWLPVLADVVYEHTPPASLLRVPTGGMPIRKRMYYLPFDFAQLLFLRTSKDTTVLTNSTYCMRRLKPLVERIRVAYPPVDVESYLCSKSSRDNTVVTCGRYDEGKNYELVLEVAEALDRLTFVIIGRSSGELSQKYFEKLDAIRKAKNLSNVRLMQNASLSSLREIMASGKVYLHSMVAEDFGIAVVEGMASGLVPVVHKSGGPWEDVLQWGKYGYGYTSRGEAIEMVAEAVKSKRSREELIQRAKDFTKEQFVEKIKGVLIEAMERKSIRLS